MRTSDEGKYVDILQVGGLVLWRVLRNCILQ
jgi:hypothetical protein